MRMNQLLWRTLRRPMAVIVAIAVMLSTTNLLSVMANAVGEDAAPMTVTKDADDIYQVAINREAAATAEQEETYTKDAAETIEKSLPEGLSPSGELIQYYMDQGQVGFFLYRLADGTLQVWAYNKYPETTIQFQVVTSSLGSL